MFLKTLEALKWYDASVAYGYFGRTRREIEIKSLESALPRSNTDRARSILHESPFKKNKNHDCETSREDPSDGRAKPTRH